MKQESPSMNKVTWSFPTRRIVGDGSRPYVNALATLWAMKEETLLPILQHLNGWVVGKAEPHTKFLRCLLLEITDLTLGICESMIEVFTTLAIREQSTKILENGKRSADRGDHLSNRLDNTIHDAPPAKGGRK